MISLSKRVLHTIDLLKQGEFEFALEQASICIDISAKRHYKKNRSSANDYKNFLDKNGWMMELMQKIAIFQIFQFLMEVISRLTVPDYQISFITVYVVN